MADRVQRRDKLFEKDTEVQQVHRIIIDASAAVFTDIGTLLRRTPEQIRPRLDEFLTRLRSLYEFADKQMKEISARYGMKVDCPSEVMSRLACDERPGYCTMKYLDMHVWKP